MFKPFLDIFFIGCFLLFRSPALAYDKMLETDGVLPPLRTEIVPLQKKLTATEQTEVLGLVSSSAPFFIFHCPKLTASEK